MAKDRSRMKPGRSKAQAGRGKNHSTNRERSRTERKNAQKGKHIALFNAIRARRFKEQVAAYWSGVRDEYPRRLAA